MAILRYINKVNTNGALFRQVLGRNVRDFINELDNLHEYFRFSFPKVQPPSFCVEEECETSLTLHYRSTRKGFTQFVKGEEQNFARSRSTAPLRRYNHHE